jgi:hypothetical protein
MLSKLHILIFFKKNVGASYPYDMFFAYTDGIMRPNDLEIVTNDSLIILYKIFNLQL